MIEVDLYDTLLKGKKKNDIKLNEGDTIFVPATTSTATITGAVVRPGIYEINENESLKDLVDMAGGALNEAYLFKVRVSSLLTDIKTLYPSF